MAEHTFDQAVTVLHERNILTGWGKPYTVQSLAAICRTRNIPSLRDRLETAGMLTLTQIAHHLTTTPATIKNWQRAGLITGRRVNARREYLYHPGQHRPLGNPRRDAALLRQQQALSDPSATLNPAPSSRRQHRKASGITSSTEGAV